MPKRRDRLEDKIENWLTIGLFVVCILVIASVLATTVTPQHFGFPVTQNEVRNR